MITLTRTAEMQAWARAHRAERIGFVPTMGFLHAGHTSLMDHLRPDVDLLVASIFINPLQFAPGEDLDQYPRDPEGDSAKCEAHGVDVLFVPDDFYPDDFTTRVAVHRLTERLCGASRPDHFGGVTTVVSRLFGVTGCNVACFGEKDYQQLAVIRRMVRDLALPVEVVGAPLVRDVDGLALSSRNKYLSVDDRKRALNLHQALFAMREARQAGTTDVSELLAVGTPVLQAGCEPTQLRVDYLEIVDADTLEPVSTVDRPCRAMVAAFLGSTRLIDNIAL